MGVYIGLILRARFVDTVRINTKIVFEAIEGNIEQVFEDIQERYRS